ncbi:hypothetical protein D3C80_2036040 [compost metagenome]
MPTTTTLLEVMDLMWLVFWLDLSKELTTRIFTPVFYQMLSLPSSILVYQTSH